MQHLILRQQGERITSCLPRFRRNCCCCTVAATAKTAAATWCRHRRRFERVAPEPPDFLDDEGRQEWERVIADLEPLGLLKNSDRGVLTAYCEAWSRFAAAVREYRAQGVTRVNPDSSRTGKHAAVSVAENAAVQIAKLGSLLAGRRSPNADSDRSRRTATATTRTPGEMRLPDP